MKISLSGLRRIRHSMASSGVVRTLCDLASMALSYDAERDHRFDRQFGTDTSGRILPDELGIEDSDARDKAILYLPSPPSVTRWMLRNVVADPAGFTFIDLGCGKGRVLLLASQFPFRKVVGVEISAQLCAIARRNADIFTPGRSRAPIEILNADATQVAFPDGDLLIHMYHPFDPALTIRVMEHLGRSLALRPRRVVIAYLVYSAAVPAVREAFGHMPWLRCDRYEQSVTGQYDWLLFSNA